ncbi:MAG: hypothetical protein GY696_36975 [Gammaproteobacteria bacterium]|nr:hypothetical protein [Gammaproteobacteria bacterium]
MGDSYPAPDHERFDSDVVFSGGGDEAPKGVFDITYINTCIDECPFLVW